MADSDRIGGYVAGALVALMGGMLIETIWPGLIGESLRQLWQAINSAL